MHLGIAATQVFDSNIFEIFQRVFLSTDSIVRIAAIQASAYLGWREFKEILEYLKINDQDEKLCIKASILLEAFANQGITSRESGKLAK